ncbi:hypothetical protein PM082_014556 [Marasmius tenuissimus]|nr:hypothetical protein PM082_014556 [Marasmius tenuissimus]
MGANEDLRIYERDRPAEEEVIESDQGWSRRRKVGVCGEKVELPVGEGEGAVDDTPGVQE